MPPERYNKATGVRFDGEALNVGALTDQSNADFLLLSGVAAADEVYREQCLKFECHLHPVPATSCVQPDRQARHAYVSTSCRGSPPRSELRGIPLTTLCHLACSNLSCARLLRRQRINARNLPPPVMLTYLKSRMDDVGWFFHELLPAQERVVRTASSKTIGGFPFRASLTHP